MAKRRNPKKKRRYGTRRMPESFVNGLQQDGWAIEDSSKDRRRVKRMRAQQLLTLSRNAAQNICSMFAL